MKKNYIIDEIEKTNFNAVNKKYTIDKKCLRDWRDNKNKLIIVPNKRFKYILEQSDQKSLTYQIEEDIINWINHNRLLGIGITIKSVIAYNISNFPSLNEKTFNQFYKLFQLIKKRNNITIRRASHIGQKLKQNAKEEFYLYFHNIIANRLILNIYDDNINLIINVEETSVYLESPTTIVAIKGQK